MSDRTSKEEEAAAEGVVATSSEEYEEIVGGIHRFESSGIPDMLREARSAAASRIELCDPALAELLQKHVAAERAVAAHVAAVQERRQEKPN